MECHIYEITLNSKIVAARIGISGFVIIAFSEESARALAAERAIEEKISSLFWINNMMSTCTVMDGMLLAGILEHGWGREESIFITLLPEGHVL